MAFYALADAIGKDRVNAALRRFIDKNRFQQPPYTYTRDLLAELRADTPPELAFLIEDLFETITLFDNRTTKATAQKRTDGRYDVTLQVEAKKLRADDLGTETEQSFAQQIDIGGIDDNDKAIALERVMVKPGAQTLHFVSATLPKKAGIDPLHKLVDRVINDNVVNVEPE